MDISSLNTTEPLSNPEWIPPHNHDGVNTPRVDYNTLLNKPNLGASGILFFFTLGNGLGAGTTAYVTTSVGSSESTMQFAVPTGGTITNMYTNLTSSQPASGSAVLTLRKNGSDTPVSITIAANAGTGIYKDTAHSVTVVAGDLIDIKWVNNSSSLISNILYVALKFAGS